MGSILLPETTLLLGLFLGSATREAQKGSFYVAKLHNTSWSFNGLTNKNPEQIRHGDTSTDLLPPLNGHPPPIALIQGQTLTQMYLA